MVREMEVIVTHGDMDGVAASGLYLYLRDNPESVVYFTEPYKLHSVLSQLISSGCERVVIIDLGVNPSIYSELLENLKLLRSRGVSVLWYDHHVWEENWIRDIRDLGVELYIDTSTCATGVVAKYTQPLRKHLDYEFIDKLTRGVCAGDLWKFDYWLAPYYIRLIRRRDKDSWKRRVLIYIASGNYWSGEFNSKIEKHVDLELGVLTSSLNVYIKNINEEYRIAVVEDNKIIDSSFIAPYIMGRFNVNIVAIVSKDGKVSFRGMGVNVRDIAVRLGGGGHLYASGAKIKIPWYIRVISRLRRDALLGYVASIIIRELKSTYSG